MLIVTFPLELAPAFAVARNWTGFANQNLNNPIAAGMQLLTFPSHRCGGILGGDALFMALPQLPEQSPYDTANEYGPNPLDYVDSN